MSSSQWPTPTTRLETCSEKCVTSKLGRPEASSITIFGRCCCSGICSDCTLMPVSASNSFSCFCRLSARGLLVRLTMRVWPLNCCQSNADCAPARRTIAGAASRTVEAANKVRRRIIPFLLISRGCCPGTSSRFSEPARRGPWHGPTPPRMPAARARKRGARGWLVFPAACGGEVWGRIDLGQSAPPPSSPLPLVAGLGREERAKVGAKYRG